MAESTLSIAWRELQARVGSFLGWGRGAYYNDQAWNDYQQFELDGIVASGLRAFYFPKPTEDSPGVSYDWTFLKPVATLALASGASVMALPDDFGGCEGQVTINTTSSTAQPWMIEWRNEAAIRQLFSVTPAMTGPPMYVATAPLKGTGPTQSNRWQMIFFPLSDQAYNVQFQYYINPDYLSVPFPYAYGGAPHAETILESCLAVAEQRLDDSMGVHAMNFQERLSASVSMDRRNKAQKLGPNLDRSDYMDRRDRVNVHWYAPAATYGGNPFG